MVLIRQEEENDYPIVEDIVRKSFYNVYMPGCTEHYLAHVMRRHADFIPQLDLVLELDGQIIGSIMYTKARLAGQAGEEKEILTFGPVCVWPAYQRKGYGRQLMEYSFAKAKEMGWDTIVIFGDPNNYVSRGFQSCKKHNVCLPDGTFPAAMLVKELTPNALGKRKWAYYQSEAMEIDGQEAERFDEALEKLEKKHLPSQETFYIRSHAVIL